MSPRVACSSAKRLSAMSAIRQVDTIKVDGYKIRASSTSKYVNSWSFVAVFVARLMQAERPSLEDPGYLHPTPEL